ncbi:hypothetical protein NHQ30_011456 [Ciborinia camelliae]|nr:hypothetical protein NHQ30_011456 [Ciborinia camelliae]
MSPNFTTIDAGTKSSAKPEKSPDILKGQEEEESKRIDEMPNLGAPTETSLQPSTPMGFLDLALDSTDCNNLEADKNTNESRYPKMNTELIHKPGISGPTETSPHSLTPTPKTFLGLPSEIRLIIYRFYFPPKRIIEVCPPECNILNNHPDVDEGLNQSHLVIYEPNKNSININILLLSKPISEEALNILYGESVFRMMLNPCAVDCLKEKFTETNMQRIRHLRVITPDDSRFGQGDNIEFWDAFLPTLKTFLIVAKQPSPDSVPHWKLLAWLFILSTHLLCFSSYLSARKTTVGMAVFLGREHTMEFARICLPDSVRISGNCTDADFSTQNGTYSWEKGYWDDYFFGTSSR